MLNFKLGGIAAVFGFALSLIIGLITKNGAFAIVRALTFGIFFFILSNILLMVVRRFLPELLDMGSDLNENHPGSRINISEGGDESGNLLGDEAGLEHLGSSGGGEAQPDFSPERFGDSGYSAGLDGEDRSGGAFAGGGLGGAPSEEAFSGESLGNLNRGSGGGEFRPGLPIAGPALDQIKETGYNRHGDAEVNPPQVQAPKVSLGIAALPEADSNSMDVLPDFEAMSQAFLASTQEREQSGEDGGDDSEGGTTEDVFSLSVSGQSLESSIFSPDEKPSGLEGDYQPKQVAQAIQTILKRDEKE
ncbi:MAG: hypothetical protein LBT16_07415 [Treponema sp.]|nr:hypothetical protein [Treponema sp.]